MQHPMDRLVAYTLGGGLPKSLFIVGLILGVLALLYTAREEEPQIVVPMVDVLVQAPGLDVQQVERQVAIPLEKLLAQIPGIEHVYSTSTPGQASVTLAFEVGEDREESLLNTYNKLYSNQHQIPAVVSNWQLLPVEVDDVAIVVLALWSSDPQRYSDYDLRRVADEFSTHLQRLPDTGEVTVTGGRSRQVQILLNPEGLASRRTTAADIVSALRVSNQLVNAGHWSFNNESILLESGDALRSPEALPELVVNVIDGAPVYLQEVAQIVDGPEEPDVYNWIAFSQHAQRTGATTEPEQRYPMVTLNVAKKPGTNAVNVAARVHAEMAQLKRDLLPADIHIETLRDYGQTADEKVNNLVTSLGFAIFTVVVFISVFLGWRAALVVGLAVPVCYGFTLALDLVFGYTINRVTLFALILSLGLLVDDPITGIDNISRKLIKGRGTRGQRIVDAMAEIRVPLLMSTLTIVFAFLPLAFITGMMGPYMAPMAFNVPVAVISSTVIAFLVTPWLASRLLQPTADDSAVVAEDSAGEEEALYSRWMRPLLARRRWSKVVIYVVVVLFLLAASLPLFRVVPLKLLPYDNKNEVQVMVDMPESATLEHTAAVSQRVSRALLRIPEVQAVAAFVGEPSPVDFNGMVRRHYQRHASYLADLRVTLVDKSEREHQSHAVVLRMRELLEPLQTNGLILKVVEVPPGPPVMSTLVAEIHADTLTPYARQREAALQLAERMRREPHVVEVDTSVEDPSQRWRFITDKAKAALSGVSTADINQAIAMANEGYVAGYLQQSNEARPLPVTLRLPPEQRVSKHDFQRLQVKGRAGIIQASSPQGLDAAPQPLVALGELGEFSKGPAEQAIHRKDLRPVVYVTAELSGRPPADVIADLVADRGAQNGEPSPWQGRTFLSSGGGDDWQLPAGTHALWTGEGEWKITVEVFRDLGLAFAFALVVIFGLLRVQTGSVALALIIMAAIPLTVIGIMPGFWLLNLVGDRTVAGAPDPVLFTATAMIGMIALAGIVVRNSLILVEFITQARAQGASVVDALLEAGSIRMRPVLLTAGTTLLGNLVIILDPVFSGLALAIIFGVVASTLLTLVVVPVVYLLVFEQPADKA